MLQLILSGLQLCFLNQCVHITNLSYTDPCPIGSTGEMCSGNGVSFVNYHASTIRITISFELVLFYRHTISSYSIIIELSCHYNNIKDTARFMNPCEIANLTLNDRT